MTTDASDSNPPPAYDAQNVSETKKEADAACSRPEPRYVYYRVYSRDGAIPSKTAFDPRNPFVGRVTARSIPPPHNATSLKRCLVKGENLTDPDGSRTVLYRSPEAPYALGPGETVAILGPEMPNGGTPETAFALVLQEDLTDDENAALNQMDLSGRCEMNPKYLYYQLFTQTGEDTSKVSFNSDEPGLGRIERIFVSPPHGADSIKRHIAKVEGQPIYIYSQLYEDISAQGAMNNRHFPLMHNTSVGWTEEKPIVLVQPERRPGLFNRPIKVLSNTYVVDPFCPAIGELGHTDGVPTSRYMNGLGHVMVYSCKIKVKFVYRPVYLPADYIKFLDE